MFSATLRHKFITAENKQLINYPASVSCLLGGDGCLERCKKKYGGRLKGRSNRNSRLLKIFKSTGREYQFQAQWECSVFSLIIHPGIEPSVSYYDWISPGHILSQTNSLNRKKKKWGMTNFSFINYRKNECRWITLWLYLWPLTDYR